ncbi:MAG: Phosphate transport system permease protein PstC [Peptostreptococcus russellii]
MRGMEQMKSFEKIMKYVFIIASLVSVLSIVVISVFIFKGGVPFIKDYGLIKFLTGTEWLPGNTPASFGLLPMILGSLYVTVGAMIIGVPIGVLTAIYMAKFCPDRLYKVLSPAVQLMAGIPSIVYGFFALNVITPLVRNISGDGLSILTASILLAIMILPTVITLSEASIRAVPKSYYEGSIALGANDEESVFRTVVPAAKNGIMASIILAMGRAIGETMAVLRVAGNQTRIPDSIFDGGRTLTTNIAMEMSYAEGMHRESLIATAVVLFVFILVINSIFMMLKRRDTNC